MCRKQCGGNVPRHLGRGSFVELPGMASMEQSRHSGRSLCGAWLMISRTALTSAPRNQGWLLCALLGRGQFGPFFAHATTPWRFSSPQIGRFVDSRIICQSRWLFLSSSLLLLFSPRSPPCECGVSSAYQSGEAGRERGWNGVVVYDYRKAPFLPILVPPPPLHETFSAGTWRRPGVSLPSPSPPPCLLASASV